MNKKEALEYFMEIYKGPWPEQELKNDFEECWKQLKSSQQKYMFGVNQCYTKENGKCIVYFHMLNLKNDSYYDITLNVWNNMPYNKRKNFQIHYSIF